MDAHKFMNFDAEFDLNNPNQPSKEDLLEMVGIQNNAIEKEEENGESTNTKVIASRGFKDAHVA